MSVETFRENVGSLPRRVGNFVDWHLRGIRYTSVHVDPDSLPDNSCPCLLCGGRLKKTALSYELDDPSTPTPWPKSMFDAVGALPRRILSLVRRYRSVRPN